MVRVSELQESAMLQCPNCGEWSEAEPIQLQGRCSLICVYCEFHFYVTPKVNGIAQVVEGARAKVA